MVYCVCRAVFDKESKEGEDAVDKEGDDESVDKEEDGKPPTHDCGSSVDVHQPEWFSKSSWG